MDPNAALAELRDKIEHLETEDPAVEELVSQFEGLDQWLTKGGFLPEPWSTAGRATSDREVVEGVKHGTRRGYNAGCGCGPCRMANRKRRNLTPEEMAAFA